MLLIFYLYFLHIQTPVEKVLRPPKYVKNTKPQEVFGCLGDLYSYIYTYIYICI